MQLEGKQIPQNPTFGGEKFYEHAILPAATRVQEEKGLKNWIGIISLIFLCTTLSCGSDENTETDTSVAFETGGLEDLALADLTETAEDSTSASDVTAIEDTPGDEDSEELDVLTSPSDATDELDVQKPKDMLPPKDKPPGKDMLPPKDKPPAKDVLPIKEKPSATDGAPGPAVGIDGNCIPDCQQKMCGPDGCGGECGLCPDGMTCTPIGNCKPDNPLVPCDNDGYTAVAESVSQFGTSSIGYAANSALSYPNDRMTIEIFQSPLFGGPTEVGTYPITGENYSNCGICILIKTYPEPGGAPDKIFFAKEGEVNFTSLGEDGNFSGSLNAMLLKEVTIDENFNSTPVVGGQNWCIALFEFSAVFP